MTRFIAGILVCLLVQAIGLPALVSGLRSVDSGVRSAYATAAEQWKGGAK